ncbi:MAG: DUF1552 domain-containing protein [Planctomycetaceae bacterium]|nr:DUF1552 domain-containing protein [Planctomycetaceae bacterium]MCP4776794.1 DUF1552 domain-containing protein [Planctomycetaceae bacterium]
MRNQLHLNRRQFLRGTGMALSIPLLETFSVANIGPEPIPRRMVCIGNSFGMYQPQFFPKTAGADYQSTPLLKPLEKHRRDFTVFSHLDHGIRGGHYAIHSFLSGVKYSDAAAMPAGNISLDQRMAEVVGVETRLPSLTVGSENGLHGGCMMSWTRTGVRVPPIQGPRELFQKLFLNEGKSGNAKAVDQFALRGSILDAVQGDAESLGKRISGRDRKKLDEYFSSVRDVERRIQQRERWRAVPKPKAPIEQPQNKNLVDDIPELYELIALALEIDSTRIASLELAGANFNTGLLNLKKGYHALSHHGQDPSNIAGLVKLETYQMLQFSKFLDRLKSVKGVHGETLLDQTAVLFGSGMGNANAHTNSDLPIILAGGGFRLGEHRVMPENKAERVPLCNLFVSLLQRMGIEDDRFGHSTGTLTGLELVG